MFQATSLSSTVQLCGPCPRPTRVLTFASAPTSLYLLSCIICYYLCKIFSLVINVPGNFSVFNCSALWSVSSPQESPDVCVCSYILVPLVLYYLLYLCKIFSLVIN